MQHKSRMPADEPSEVKGHNKNMEQEQTKATENRGTY
ncbi:hypothetical protein Pla144_38830 [Bythopirellula polymerisocia]|uniref:Uncharacterized protein n=1 Tax=Bythopirellula polymerisocia TaxID=2528003 RepID=A0A5C6CH78_9BACT|nr:hypothetical protein Pla144_38830 [Bythopirellula polymerisocia]